MSIVTSRIAPPTFGYVRRHGNGGSTQLIAKTEAFFGWESSLNTINMFDKVHRLLPDDKLSVTFDLRHFQLLRKNFQD